MGKAKIFASLCAALAFGSTGFAQSSWSTYDPGYASIFNSSIALGPDGSVYFTFTSSGLISILRKYSRFGALQWQKQAVGDPDFGVTVTNSAHVAVAPGGNVLWTYVSHNGTTATRSHLAASVFTPSGTQLGSTVYGHPSTHSFPLNDLMSEAGLVMDESGVAHGLCEYSYSILGPFYFDGVAQVRITTGAGPSMTFSGINLGGVIPRGSTGFTLYGNVAKGPDNTIMGAFCSGTNVGPGASVVCLYGSAGSSFKSNAVVNYAVTDYKGDVLWTGHRELDWMSVDRRGEVGQPMLVNGASYQESSGMNSGQAIMPLPDGKFVVVGNLAKIPSSSSTEPVMLRFDGNGVYLNQFRFTAPTAHYGQTFWNVMASDYGEVVATGGLNTQNGASYQALTAWADQNVGLLGWFWRSDGTQTNGIHTVQDPGTGDYVLVQNFANHTGLWYMPLAPQAVNDTYSKTYGELLSVPAPGVLANDRRKAYSTLTVTRQPRHGAVSILQDGSFTYTATSGFFGVDSFDYQLARTAGTSKATVLIRTNPIPDTWDLARDYVEGVNPNGAWRVRCRTTLLPFVQGWIGNQGQFSSPQAAYAPNPLIGFVPAWYQSRDYELFTNDIYLGDVITHSTDPANAGMSGEGNITWTAPFPATVTISGGIWNGKNTGRGNMFRLWKNGVFLSAGSISSGDGHTWGNMLLLTQGTGGPGVAQIPVAKNDVLMIEILRTTTYGEFAGLEWSIRADRSSTVKL